MFSNLFQENATISIRKHDIEDDEIEASGSEFRISCGNVVGE
jgi:hypothetical protein